jgi:hypothetical protein
MINSSNNNNIVRCPGAISSICGTIPKPSIYVDDPNIANVSYAATSIAKWLTQAIFLGLWSPSFVENGVWSYLSNDPETRIVVAPNTNSLTVMTYFRTSCWYVAAYSSFAMVRPRLRGIAMERVLEPYEVPQSINRIVLEPEQTSNGS